MLGTTMRRIASRVSQLNGEGALAVFARAKELEKQGRSIIHLELGEPDFHPAAPVVDAVRAAVAGGRDRYVATRGIPALREAIAAYLKRTRRLEVAAEEVLVAPGCKMALALAMMALIEPGDEVLYPDPSFPIYPSFTRGLGATAVPFFLAGHGRGGRKNLAAHEDADVQFAQQSDGNGFQRGNRPAHRGVSRSA
jgi:aspartate aminotransferase